MVFGVLPKDYTWKLFYLLLKNHSLFVYLIIKDDMVGKECILSRVVGFDNDNRHTVALFKYIVNGSS